MRKVSGPVESVVEAHARVREPQSDTSVDGLRNRRPGATRSQSIGHRDPLNDKKHENRPGIRSTMGETVSHRDELSRDPQVPFETRP